MFPKLDFEDYFLKKTEKTYIHISITVDRFYIRTFSRFCQFFENIIQNPLFRNIVLKLAGNTP